MQPFPRRRFLELTLVSAGAVFGPIACGSDDPESTLRSERVFPQSVASGDPRPHSVVLWTRVVDSAQPGADLDVSLELAEDLAFSQIVSLDGGSQRSLRALAEFDHCLKTRLTGLKPGSYYYYRFSYMSGGARVTSRVGRTKTAPADDADVKVRFAVVSCQDYAGKYFHAYRHLAALEVDFVVHLGDYIYETTADPSFQAATEERRVTFSAPDEARSLAGGAFQAAQSLGNYRDLYRLYRADPDLQAVHERFAMIAIQDDHEFSDDSHGEVANYSDGRESEVEPERRLAADQAWFEYMPVDFAAAPSESWDAKRQFPEQLTYYRSFAFGRHVELVMTDLRRYRPDHLVPEDAFPGAVFLDEAALTAISGDLPESAVPYVDIESFEGGRYLDALSSGAAALGIRRASLTGSISVPFINGSLAKLGVSDPPAIDAAAPEFERGYAYHQLLKTEEFSRIGARYVVALEPFMALSKAKFIASAGQSERLMGDAQRAWFLDTMRASTRTFKIWGSEICVMPKHVDLRPVTLAPPELRQKISISAEDWDGFPSERAALLAELAQLDNIVIVSGDLHCFFAGTPYANEDSKQRVVEFVTGSLTSTTWRTGLTALAGSNSSLPEETKFIAASVGSLLVDPSTRPNPHLAFQNLSDNGYAVFEVDGERLTARLFSVPTAVIATPSQDLDRELATLFSEQKFEVLSGAADLFRTEANGRERWDVDRMSWVSAAE